MQCEPSQSSGVYFITVLGQFRTSAAGSLPTVHTQLASRTAVTSLASLIYIRHSTFSVIHRAQ